MFYILLLAIVATTIYNVASQGEKVVLMTEVFAIPIEPTMFNWTFDGIDEQFVYRPTLFNKPDLPPWINYKYSKRHHSGFLYGVPQKHSAGFQLEIIALNQLDYETRRHSFYIHVTEKLSPARHEVQLKIDNLNVEDMFDIRRMNRLQDVFRNKLWKESEPDLYVTFLESAVQLGARVPLRPNEGEGVVIRLGSRADFSAELLELQEEVRPLWKLQSCPRDFKRTTVERVFREAGFALDWCSFRLLTDDALTAFTPDTNVERPGTPNIDRWLSVSKKGAPVRNYSFELLLTTIISVLVILVLVWVLSMVLCFHHDDGIHDDFDQLFDPCVKYYESKRSRRSIQASRVELTAQPRSLQIQQQNIRTPIFGKENIQYNLTDTIIRSRNNSPNGTLTKTYCRPSPPPYPAASKHDL